MKITAKQLQNMGACSEGIEWFQSHKYRSLKTIITGLVKENKYPYGNWLLTHLMTQPQRVQYAIYSAELVIKSFEEKFPNDLRPRKAIKAAKDFLKDRISLKDLQSAAKSAADSASSAAYSAAEDACLVAWAAWAAYSAAKSANSAAYWASADSAKSAANSAAKSAASQKEVYTKCFNFSLKILGEI